MADELKILVVDDEPKICELLRALLRREGYAVDVTYSAQEALQRLSQGDYAMMLTDLKMPGMDGLELVTRSKQMRSDLSVIMVTGYATVETAVGALRHGVDDYVTKPFNIDELRKVVSKTLSVRRLARVNQELMDQLKVANTTLEQQRDKLAHMVTTATGHLDETLAALRHRIEDLATVNEIGRLVASALDLDRVLNLCLDALCGKMDIQTCSIMLLDSERGELVVKASRGAKSAEILGTRQKADVGVAGWVIRTTEPLLVEDIAQDPRFPKRQSERYAGSSFLCVPLSLESRVMGVISAADKRSRIPFTQSDLNLLVTVAGPLSIAMENARLYQLLQENCFSTVKALAISLEAKDGYTSGHSQRVTEYATTMANALGLTEKDVVILQHAGMLHDIGKIGITEQILNKRGRLSDEEYQVIRSHPVTGQRIIQSLEFLRAAREPIRNHHERWDGTGYPDALHGQRIPLLARIMAVADAYDAMTSNRPYRPPMPKADAIRELQAAAGAQFDPELTSVFTKTLAASADGQSDARTS